MVLTIPMPGHPFTQDREKEKEKESDGTSSQAYGQPQERVGESHSASPIGQTQLHVRLDSDSHILYSLYSILVR